MNLLRFFLGASKTAVLMAALAGLAFGVAGAAFPFAALGAPAVLLGASAWFASRYPLSRAVHREILRRLAVRTVTPP